MSNSPENYSFVDWAALSAKIRIASPAEQARLLASAMLSAPAWIQVHESWAERMNEDIASGRMELPERYAAACLAEQQRQQAGFRQEHEPTPAAPIHGMNQPIEGPDQPIEGPVTKRTSHGSRNHSATAQHPVAATEGPFPLAEANLPANRNRAEVVAPGGDFRHNLTPLGDPIERARPAQHGTMQRINAVELRGETNRVLEAVQWSVEQYARWSAALEQHTHDVEGQRRLWQVIGILNISEQVYVLNRWNLRLSQDPDLNLRYQRLLAECRLAYQQQNV